jgi:MFS family permease
MSRNLSQSRYRRLSPQPLARVSSREETQGTKSPIAWFVEIVSLVTAVGTILSVLLFNSLLSDGRLLYIQFASLSDMLRDGLALTIISLAPFMMVSPVAVALVLLTANAMIYEQSAKAVRDRILLTMAIGAVLAAFLVMPYAADFLDLFGWRWRIVAPLWAQVLVGAVIFGLAALINLIAMRRSVAEQRRRSVIILKAFLESRKLLLALLCLFAVSAIAMAGHLTEGELNAHRVVLDRQSEPVVTCLNAKSADPKISLIAARLVWSGERAIVVRCAFRARSGSTDQNWEEQLVILNPGRLAL